MPNTFNPAGSPEPGIGSGLEYLGSQNPDKPPGQPRDIGHGALKTVKVAAFNKPKTPAVKTLLSSK